MSVPAEPTRWLHRRELSPLPLLLSVTRRAEASQACFGACECLPGLMWVSRTGNRFSRHLQEIVRTGSLKQNEFSLAKTRMETFQDVQTGKLDVVSVTHQHFPATFVCVEKRKDTHSVTTFGCSSGLAVLLLTD